MNGVLLVEMHNEKQAETILKDQLLGSYPIHAEEHVSLNSSMGDVYTYSLDRLFTEEIQIDLADQSVSRAYRLLRKRDKTIFFYHVLDIRSSDIT
jgi:hypothetical protein